MEQLTYLLRFRNHASAPRDIVYQDCPGSASIITASNRSGADKRSERKVG